MEPAPTFHGKLKSWSTTNTFANVAQNNVITDMLRKISGAAIAGQACEQEYKYGQRNHGIEYHHQSVHLSGFNRLSNLRPLPRNIPITITITTTMLVLIAGITGHLGQHIGRHAIAKGLSVRGLGRNPSKLDPTINLESFVQAKTYYDIPALDAAVSGVDAIIVAYMGTPELQVDGHLLLLRAAERAGVNIFHTSTWTYDFRKTRFLEHESYDPFVAFARIAELTSPIKPIYMFSGVLAEVLFSLEGRADFSPKSGGVFDPVEKCFEYYGTGDEKYQWTTEEDAARFSVELIMSEEAKSGNGGYFSAWSGEHSVKEIAQVYEKVRGKPISLKNMGTVKDLERKALADRAASTPAGFWGYIGAFYQLFTINERWVLTDENLFPDVERTGLETFFRQSNI